MATTTMSASSFLGGSSGHFQEHFQQAYTPPQQQVYQHHYVEQNPYANTSVNFYQQNYYARQPATTTGAAHGYASAASYDSRPATHSAHRSLNHSYQRNHHHSHHTTTAMSTTAHHQSSGGYHNYAKYNKASALLRSKEPIPTTNLKEHDPLDKKALDSWREYKHGMQGPEMRME